MRRFLSATIVLALAAPVLALDGFIRQGDARWIQFGPMYDKTDGVTPKTNLTLHAAHIRLSKNGGSWAAKTSPTNPTHYEDGMYYVELYGADTSTAGLLMVKWYDPNVVSVPQTYAVLTPAAYDAMFGSANWQVDVTKWSGTTVATPDTAGYPKVTHKVGTGAGELSVTSGVVNSNVTQWAGSTNPLANFTNVFYTAFGTAYDDVNDVWNNRLRYVSKSAGLSTINDVKVKCQDAIEAKKGVIANEVQTHVDANSVPLAAVKTVTDKINTGLEADGLVYRWTVNALELSPAPSGAVDWSTAEKEQIRDALGVTGNKTTAAGGQLQTVKTASDRINAAMEDDLGVYRFTANALEQSPAVAAATDWTAAERENIRQALGVTGTKTAGSGGLIQDVYTVTDKLGDTFEDDGGIWRFTANSLEQSPAVAAATDWTTAERQQIRSALGVDGTKTTASGGQLQTVKTVTDNIATAYELDGGVYRWTANSLELGPMGAMDWTTAEKENIRSALGVTGTKTAASGGQLQTVKGVTDKVDTGLELDGAVYRWTVNSLEQSPAAAAATDWTTAEKENIRSALGVTGTKTAGSGGVIHDIDTVTDKVNTAMELDVSVYRFTTNALEQSPAAAAATDWTTAERQQIRSALGVDGTKTTASGGQLQTVKTTTDKVDSALELDGGVYRYTLNALEQAPQAGSVLDWTTAEKQQIRSALGVDGTKVAATGGQVQSIKTTTDKVDGMLELDGAVYRYTSNATELAPSSTGGGWTPLNKATAQAGTINTITLAASASATNNIYRYQRVTIYGGTGAGQSNIILSYNGTTKVATVLWPWVTIPASNSQYEIQAAEGRIYDLLRGLWR